MYGHYRLFNNPYDHVFKIQDERDLHYKVVDFIKHRYPDAITIGGLGENQDTVTKRIDSKRKGYLKGQPDLIIMNLHKRYNGFAIEFKAPKGHGSLLYLPLKNHFYDLIGITDIRR